MNVVITGANRGIGLELTKIYVSRGCNVFALCRRASDELKKLGAEIYEDVDVRQIDKFEHDIKDIDLLINNAGLFLDENIDQIDDAAIERIRNQFEVNALAPLRVVAKFLVNLSSGAKICMVTSRMGSIADNTSGGRYGYRMSKCALNMATKSISLDLKDRKISAGVFHPGWVQTEMTGRTGNLSASESAELLVKRFDELNLKNSGSFWHCNGELLPW